MSAVVNERFSGHESFVCRYGWLPKIFKAIEKEPRLLKDELAAMTALGIGRNMVKSLQFWAESTGVLAPNGTMGHLPGPVGTLLFGKAGWDRHLESLESLWLIHWQLSTAANLAAWNVVFGEGKIVRFDRARLIAFLAQRGGDAARPLAPSTLEQHVSILVNSYFQAERSNDDTSWCPLQDLSIVTGTESEDGRIIYDATISSPVGLSLRVFGKALIDFISRHGLEATTVDFRKVLSGAYSPGVVFRLDEHQLRGFVENAAAGPFKGAIRFVDTADTQNIVLQPKKLDSQFRTWLKEEAHEHA